MNYKPKNGTFYVDRDKWAELFFQSVNMDHFIQRYVDDMDKPNGRRAHHLMPTDVLHVLRSGNIMIQKKGRSNTHHYAIAFWKEQYYYAEFYLDTRDDCPQLFAILISCYATNNKDVHDRYETWLDDQKKLRGRKR